MARVLLPTIAEAGRALPQAPPDHAVISLKQVLVATDFSDPSEVALSYGRQLARSFGATLHVLHVVEDFATRLSGSPNVPEVYVDFGQWQRDAVAAAGRELEKVLSDEDRRELGAKAVAVLARAAAPAILEYAREHRIDLIVLGTHGRGALGHLLMGSVAERVVRLASCPVLTVRHPERDFVLPDALVAVTRQP